MSIDEKKIARINELYRRSKAEGLTDAEKQEQKLLRLEYIQAIRCRLYTSWRRKFWPAVWPQ